MEDISVNVIFIILQQPLEKRQPLAYVEHTALMTTTGETVKIEEWASNVQGETMTFFFFKKKKKKKLFHLLLVSMVCRFISLWSHTVQIILNILVQ